MSFPRLPILIVHDRAQALAAFAAARALRRAVQIETPADMGHALGPAWMRAFLDACAAERIVPPGPVVYACVAPGPALAALRLNLPAVRFAPSPDMHERIGGAIAAIARGQEAELLLGPPEGQVWRFPPPSGAPDAHGLELAARRWLAALPPPGDLG